MNGIGLRKSSPVTMGNLFEHIRFMLRDDFTDIRAAGGVNGTEPTPGPGIRTVNDTGNKLSVDGDKMVVAGTAGGTTYGNPGIRYPSITREAGKMLMVEILQTATGRLGFGFADGTDVAVFGNWDAIFYCTSWTTNRLAYTGSIDIPCSNRTASVSYLYAMVLRATGAYLFTRGGTEYPFWTLLNILNLGNSATLYPVLFGQTGDFTSEFARIPYEKYLPMPDAYDTFTRADGAIGTSEVTGPDGQGTPPRVWTGSTWTILSNQAVNTPVPGGNNTNNSGFETAGGGGADVFANWTETALGTSTVNDDAVDFYAGAHSFRGDVDAAASACAVSQTIVQPAGQWRLHELYCKISDVTKRIRVGNGSGWFAQFDPAAWSYRCMTVKAVLANEQLSVGRQPGSASFSFWADEVFSKALTLSELFASVKNATPDVLVSCVPTFDADNGLQGGLVVCLDSAAIPANFILVYYNRADGRIWLEKCVAGTYTSLANTLTTYSATAVLWVIKYGSSVAVFYNNLQIGSTATVSDAGIVNNTLHGIFSTGTPSQVQIDNFTIFPRGTEGRYEGLNKYTRGGI